jgi:hypothetical protein
VTIDPLSLRTRLRRHRTSALSGFISESFYTVLRQDGSWYHVVMFAIGRCWSSLTDDVGTRPRSVERHPFDCVSVRDGKRPVHFLTGGFCCRIPIAFNLCETFGVVVQAREPPKRLCCCMGSASASRHSQLTTHDLGHRVCQSTELDAPTTWVPHVMNPKNKYVTDTWSMKLLQRQHGDLDTSDLPVF